MRIVNLASGSKANSTLLEFEDTKILIDAGLSEKNLKERLFQAGANLNQICGVCITHEHTDHFASVEILAKKFDIDFYVHEKLAESRFIKDIQFKEGRLHTFSDKMFSVGSFDITPFEISHDAISPVGFVVQMHGSKSKVGFVTDLGIVTETVKKSLYGVKIAFIESNYDEKMLLGGKYPYIVKKRIYGDKGHLSNVQSLELAKELYKYGTKCFVLSHISQNNNTPELAIANYVDYFESVCDTEGDKVIIKMSYQNKIGNNFTLKEEF